MLAVCTTWMGCESNTPRNPDAGTPPDASVPDASVPDASVSEDWDGTYVPLEETDEWDYLDPGRFAACGFIFPGDGGTGPACGSPESFDLSSCESSTLGQLSPSGIYAAAQRGDVINLFLLTTNFTISADGGRESHDGDPIVQKQVDSQGFYVASQRTRADGGTFLTAYAGCKAESVQRFTGCYQTCTNGGARRTWGTFEGVRLQRFDEPESSGGLTLVSEHRVGLGFPSDLYVAKNHAYVVSQNDADTGATGGLSVFDVTDRAHPILRKTISLTGDSSWNGVWARGDGLYITSTKWGVLVYDISNPADPQLVRTLPGSAASVHTVVVDGERLYAMDIRNNRVLMYDVKEPLQPLLLGAYSVPGGEYLSGIPHDAFAYQNRLYINQMGLGYYVVDVADPANPKPLGAYTYAVENNWSHTNVVGTFAGRTIAFEGGEVDGAYLRVLDVTDPAKIVKIGEARMRTQTSIHNMVLVGKRLYVTWYADGVRVFDVANPTQPKQIAHYNSFRDSDPGRTEGLLVGAIGIRVPGDGYVYSVDVTRGLLILHEP
ncbi:Hypothetical protein AA314_03669 [Archangium gephyra]|uniref:Lipoprotein n=1 Tax=Archangium gephyra TaxID=48 RepID=A0AAC8Q6N6_9BACT|nr:Hypothetical protein AA314_03669 [Archangium gephyra]